MNKKNYKSKYQRYIYILMKKKEKDVFMNGNFMTVR